MEPDEARAHVEDWIRAWNERDVDAILSHYADDVVFRASTVARRWNRPDGLLRGKAELRAHFLKGLELSPGLHFTLEEVFLCPGGFAVLYRRENGNRVIDAVLVDADGRARDVIACYAHPQR
jgi:ketosteroid isomerase-like protein